MKGATLSDPSYSENRLKIKKNIVYLHSIPTDGEQENKQDDK